MASGFIHFADIGAIPAAANGLELRVVVTIIAYSTATSAATLANLVPKRALFAIKTGKNVMVAGARKSDFFGEFKAFDRKIDDISQFWNFQS